MDVMLMKLSKTTQNQVHMTVIIFSRSRVQRSRSRTTFSENALFRRRHSDRRLTVSFSGC